VDEVYAGFFEQVDHKAVAGCTEKMRYGCGYLRPDICKVGQLFFVPFIDITEVRNGRGKCFGGRLSYMPDAQAEDQAIERLLFAVFYGFPEVGDGFCTEAFHALQSRPVDPVQTRYIFQYSFLEKLF